MKEPGTTGIYGIDTRELTKILRDGGAMKASIIPEGTSAPSMPEASTPAEVSCKEVIVYPAQPAQDVENVNGSKAAVTEGKKVVVVDCGVKHSVIRSLISRGAEVIRVPFDYDFNSLDFDGVYVSSGPGCPCACEKTVENIRKAFESGKPVFGLGLGYLLVAKAAGCEVMRLKRAHRGANQPVRKEGSNRSYITAQNSAYTIKPASVPADWDVAFINLNDGSVDGIKHKTKPFAGTQFNPEVCVGLTENVTLIDEFINKL